MLHKPEATSSGRQLIRRDGVGAALRIVQPSRLKFPHLSIDAPGLVLVTGGRKIIRGGGMIWNIDEGSAAVFAPGRRYDVLNELGTDGRYSATAIYFDPTLLAAHAEPGTAPVNGVAAIGNASHDLCQAIENAVEAVADRDLPQSIAAHRLRELLVWLNANGLSLAAPSEPKLEERIRTLVMNAPAEPWLSPAIARELAISEATLRRKLAATGTSLTGILLDVRLTAGLTLLQSTDAPVSSVAFAVGYESPSRFARRFRERFGFPPSELRRGQEV